MTDNPYIQELWRETQKEFPDIKLEGVFPGHVIEIFDNFYDVIITNQL